MKTRLKSVALAIGIGLAITAGWLVGSSVILYPVARAASHTVCSQGPPDCDYSVIQDAVDAAGGGETILVATGIYSTINNYAGQTQVLYISKTITIRGGYTSAFIEPPDPVANPTTLDAKYLGRVIFISGAISPTIEGLYITSGNAYGHGDKGGGVFVSQMAAPIISGTTIIRNSALDGGGIFSEGGLTLINTDVISNSANWKGGGVYVDGDAVLMGGNFKDNHSATESGGGLLCKGNLTLTDSVFMGNTSDSGGGGARVDGNATVSGAHFENNHNDFFEGGGLDVAGDLVMTNSVFISNTAEYLGGGARVGGNATLYGGRFEANKSLDLGGGLGVNGSLVLIGTDFISNTSVSEGGGAWVENDVTLTGGRFDSNQADSTGGGLNASGNLIMSGTVFIGNTSYNVGGGANIGGPATLNGGSFENNHSDSHGGGLGVWNGGLTMTDTEFINNTSEGDGGGARINNGASLIGGHFENNRSKTAGGGLYVFSGPLNVTATRFISNSAQIVGGGMFLVSDTSGRIVNTLFARNNANNVAGLTSHSTGSIDILHTTFVGDPASNGQAIYIALSTMGITNTIFADYPTGIAADGTTTVYEDYNLFSNVNTPTSGSTIVIGGNSFVGDPKFLNPALDDYHIGLHSQARNAGMNAGVVVDFEGDLRPSGNGFDIGFDELVVKSLYLPVIQRSP